MVGSNVDRPQSRLDECKHPMRKEPRKYWYIRQKKTRKIDLKLCHVRRNKSLTKPRYGDDISNTKKGKAE